MIKIIAYRTLIAIVVLLTTTTAYADTDKPTLLGAIFPYAQAETKDAATRLTAAENLLAATKAFSSEFPTLTPKEIDYVERELNQTASNRLTRFVNSEEYAIYTIRQAVDGAQRTLEDIVMRGEARDSTRLQEWALVAYYLHDVDLSRYNILLNNGIVQEHSFPTTAYSTAQMVLSHAVIRFPN
jgi:hypothetical protein